MLNDGKEVDVWLSGSVIDALKQENGVILVEIVLPDGVASLETVIDNVWRGVNEVWDESEWDPLFEREIWLVTLTDGHDDTDWELIAEIETAAADGETEFDKIGEIEIIELLDFVNGSRGDAEVDGEWVEIKDTVAEGQSEWVSADVELPLIDLELDDVKVSTAVYDSDLTPEGDTLAVAATLLEADDNCDIDCPEDVDWLTRTLEEIVNEAAIVCVTVGVDDNNDESDEMYELLETAVRLWVITLEVVNNGDKDDSLVIVFIE